MAVTTKKLFPATSNATTTVFSPVGIQLNNQDDLDVYVTLSGGTRVLQLRQSTGSTAQSSHPQVNNTDGLYFPAVTAGTTLYNYTLSSDNNTITFNSALPQGAVVFCERRTRDADSSYTTFASGSTIRATDLNNSSTESNFTAQDARNKTLEIEGAIFNGDIISPTYITSENIVDGTIQTADIGANQITNALVADDQIDSRHYVAGSIDLEHMSANSVDSDQYVDGSIDHVHLANDVIDGDNIQNSVINSEHYVDGSIDREHLAADIVDSTKIADDAVGAEHIQANSVSDSEIVTGTLDNRYYRENELDPSASLGQNVLDARYFTETESDARYFRQDSTETIASGDTWSGSDLKIATTGAIDLRVIDLIDDVGGFVPILHETYFPSNNPDINNGTGTIVSIQSASTDLVPSGTTVTVANGRGTGQPVIITNVPETIPSGYGFLVETTTTAHTYTFHRLVPKATEVSTIAANAVNIAAAGANVTDIHNFADLYQISTSAPTQRADSSSLVAGDLWFDSSSNKVLMIYDGSSGDGFTAATPNASDLANIAIVAGQIVFTEDLGNITDAVATATGNTTLNTVAGIATEATTVAGIASAVSTVAADATDIGVVAGKSTEIGRLGTADALADMNTLGTTAIVSDMDTLADISSNITTVAGVSGNVTTVAGIASNVTAVAGNATNINAVAADATDIGAVAGKATEIGRLGTADAVADLAILGTTDAVADMNTLGTSSNVTNMNTLAGISGNVTTVAGISSNVTTVAGNNAAVSTVANNDADISTVAGSIGNVNTTAGSISNVNTVAGSIANVNTAASNVTDINTFANRYRIASSAPSSNNDAGDLYFDTSSNELRVYNGSAWQGGVTATGNLAGTGANTFTGDQTVNANIVVSGTVDGVDVAALKTAKDSLSTTNGALVNGVTATTQSAGDASTKIATTAYTDTAISNLVDSSPSALNTLNELAAALNDDANFATTVNNSISANTSAINLRMEKAGGTFSDDVVFGGTNYNITWDKSASKFIFNDNAEATFGTGSDLTISHNGSNSFILNNTGNLIISNMDPDDDNDIHLRARQNEESIVCKNDGAVELYWGGTGAGKKLDTYQYGVNVTGNITTTSHVYWGDGGEAIFGDSADLKIFHDGSNSVIRENGTGDLYLQNGTSNILRIQSTGATVTGTCTATTFSGSGASLTSLNASNISSGTIAAARVPTLNQNTTGSSGSCTGNAATATNADTVDNLHASSFVRSDASDSMLGTLTIGDGTNSAHEIHIKKGDNNVSDHLQFYNGTTRVGEIGCEDSTWLRINNETNNNIYTPRYIRADGGFFVDGASKGIDGSGNFVNGTIAGASDYSSLLRSDADDTMNGDLTIGGNHDLRFNTGTWTGNHYGKIQMHSNSLYIGMGSNSSYAGILRYGGSDRIYIHSDGTFYPATNASPDLGQSSKRWRNLYCQKVYFSGSTNYLSYPSGDYGSVQINGGGVSGYEGFSIDGRAVFMHDGGSNTGIYNDVNNEWLFYAAHNGSSYMYNNGSSKIEATSSGASISGSLTASGNVTAYSDARLKTNVNTINDALSIVGKLRGVSFDWKETGEHSIGVIAQEVEEVLPELVIDATSTDPETKEETTVKTVDYGKMVGVLINAIKELKAEVEELKGGK